MALAMLVCGQLWGTVWGQTSFPEAPLEQTWDQPWKNSPGPLFDQPAYVGCPTPEDWRVQSHFMPSVLRYGITAPYPPGDVPVHSPDLLGQLPPHIDGQSQLSIYSTRDFSPDPFYDHLGENPYSDIDVYGGKHLNPVQRPLIEWGLPFYLNGPMPPPNDCFGTTNPGQPKLYVYGDFRTAVASNDNGLANGNQILAARLNLELDLWLTATERIHAFVGPLQEGNGFLRTVYDDGDLDYFEELDLFDQDTDTLFFEGDIGYLLGGWTGTYAPFDMPVAVGLIPLLFQNGVWLEDQFVGFALTVPARNQPWLDWSNYDVTFFAGFDELTSPAFGDNDNAHVLGVTTFIEARGGYFEIGYAFLGDHSAPGRSYHNIGLSYTRRYLNLVSNSVRVIGNAGQNGPTSARTADGALLLVENSFLTPWPYNVIPYVNFFAGLNSPQSVARAGAAGGVLRNTGILFESDNLTGYPTLDATGNDTAGLAAGIDLLAPDFSQQLILEAAFLQAYGNAASRIAPGDQYGVGLRYQLPITNAHLIRIDAMYGWLDNVDDVSGARIEYRWKF